MTPIYGGDGKRIGDWTYTPDDDTWLEWIDDYPGYQPAWYLNGIVVPDPISTDPDALTLTYDSFSGQSITATRTLNPIVGYTLCDQEDKPLQPKISLEEETPISEILTQQQMN